MTNEHLCPGCGQDYVVTRRVRQTSDVIQICPECELMWIAGTELTTRTAQSFWKWMAEHNRKALWTELEEM